MVSVLMPARNEKYLEKTIRNVLENGDDIEIIVVLDGWIPDPAIEINDPRVKFIHYKEVVGQRAAINNAAKVARGKFIMKLDAHCAVAPHFDTVLSNDCEYDVTMIPRMYNLDIDTWKPKFFDDFNHAVRMGKLHDYLYLSMNEKGELRTNYYTNGNVTLHTKRKDILIDETMSCMGPCFFMHKDRFWELGGCDEGHEGGWGQQAVEVSCKAWLSGGRLLVNKKTWFAHWFRGDIGFPYPISGNQIDRVRRYSTDLWVNDKWVGQKRKFQWLMDKFNKKSVSVDRLIRGMFNCRASGHPSPIAARKGDRYTLIDLWEKAGYKVGAEIGVGRGEYSERILNKTNCVLHCIDAWDVYPDSRLSMDRQKDNYNRTLERLKKFIDNKRCFVYKEYSDKASEKFADGSLDFVFIDGMHTFDGCALDLIKWCRKVRKGGMVAVHDYCPMNRNGVIRAVDAYTYCHQIHPWFVTREIVNTAFWVVA